ncbi:hypothetical protein GCM10022403_035710 [Streptomyces coacervatus]|uniref:Secreted protein n=1 Tax=Streptomyces coacervatus TaxID=647381 RepID=A0ABP7HPF9_9ACTN|nr:hypothetical protein [Streptomyces coacervatus]MDF2270999.1 hypothetical protein [Streptomyces coacervatus]
MLKLKNARRAVAMTAATLTAVGGATIGAAGSAGATPAHAADCAWRQVGANNTNITINGERVGYLYQEYDGCYHVRAHWVWDSYYRTHAHNHTTGAWVQVAIFDGFAGQEYDSPISGSTGPSEVAINGGNGIYYHGAGRWTAGVTIHTTWSTSPADGWTYAATATHNYHTGDNDGSPYENGTTSHS